MTFAAAAAALAVDAAWAPPVVGVAALASSLWLWAEVRRAYRRRVVVPVEAILVDDDAEFAELAMTRREPVTAIAPDPLPECEDGEELALVEIDTAAGASAELTAFAEQIAMLTEAVALLAERLDAQPQPALPAPVHTSEEWYEPGPSRPRFQAEDDLLAWPSDEEIERFNNYESWGRP